MLRRNLANIITLIRMIGALMLIRFDAASSAFLILYGLSAATDSLDGFVARSLHIESELGRKLDSVSDLLLYGIMLIKVWPYLMKILPPFALLYIMGLLLMRLVLYVVYGAMRHRFLSTHSIYNKMTGFMMFLLPYALLLPRARYYCYGVMLMGTVATLHEIIFMISEPKEHSNVSEYHRV